MSKVLMFMAHVAGIRVPCRNVQNVADDDTVWQQWPEYPYKTTYVFLWHTGIHAWTNIHTILSNRNCTLLATSVCRRACLGNGIRKLIIYFDRRILSRESGVISDFRSDWKNRWRNWLVWEGVWYCLIGIGMWRERFHGSRIWWVLCYVIRC